LYSPGLVSFARGSAANVSACTTSCALSSLPCSPCSARAVGGGDCLPCAGSTFSSTPLCFCASAVSSFFPSNLSLCPHSVSPLCAHDVARSCWALSGADVTWQAVSCVGVHGDGSSELGEGGGEVAVGFGFVTRFAVWYLSYLITSSRSASFLSSAFRLLTASFAAWGPGVVEAGLRRLPKAGMWNCEPAT
jgi:hypothetical protein